VSPTFVEWRLRSRGVRTARGGRWHLSNVKNLIDRVFL
jgi:hypothetical protein